MAEGQPHRYPTKFGASWVSVPSIAANRGPTRIPIVLTSPHSVQRARPQNLQFVRKQLSSNGLKMAIAFEQKLSRYTRLGRFSMALLAPACMAKKNGSAICSTGRKGPVDGLQIDMQAKETDLTLLSSISRKRRS
jgi:hypothetical protein